MRIEYLCRPKSSSRLPPPTTQRTVASGASTAMQCLKLAILVFAYALISSPAFTQTCCPPAARQSLIGA
jgi:hypothetical protein